MTTASVMGGKKIRRSNLELYRIIVMLLIVAHHYVVNSGLTDVMAEDPLSSKSLYLYMLGMWGKTGINCFVLITGYFMCRSHITLRKFLKLFLEIMFYKIVIWAIFVGTGYESFSIKLMLKELLPIVSIADGFTSCFLIFYLFIPFLNILVNSMDKRKHACLLALLIPSWVHCRNSMLCSIISRGLVYYISSLPISEFMDSSRALRTTNGEC